MKSDISQRDLSVLRHILDYCEEIDAAIEHFGDDEVLFSKSAVFRNAVCMPIQQIGELTKHLSDDFTQGYPQIPWRQIKGMRDWFAHQYLNMDTAVIWHVARVDVPPLKAFIEELLERDE